MKAIALKMSKAAKAAGYGVQKDGKNQAQNYAYTSAAAVKMRCGPALADVGVAVSSKFEILAIDEVPTRSGSTQQRVMMRVTVTFVCGETGETLSVEGGGSGMDSGDKAIMKAYTAAEKYAYISAFSLALGEDPESDEETDKAVKSKRISAPLALEGEEAERARAQAIAGTHNARTSQKSPERQLADGLIDHARANVNDIDSLRVWLLGNASAVKDLPTRAISYVLGHVSTHACKVVDGMNGGGFTDEWNAALAKGAQS